MSPGSLSGFLRQHYTTGNEMAGTMAAYVLGSGGADRAAAEPAPKREPKQEPRQKAKADAPEVVARSPDQKDLSKSARQKAAKKDRPEPTDAVKDAPGSEPAKAEPEKADVEKREGAPVSEPAKSEIVAADCKLEEPTKSNVASEVDDSKSDTQPDQPTALTLPGFPPPPAPEPEVKPTATAVASPGCDPAESGTTATTEAEGTSKEQAKEQPPVAAPPSVAEARKAESLGSTETGTAAPALDIMQEEVHAPRPARALQQKRRLPLQPQEQP
ncbi:hypothetical protein RCO31_19280 [Bradyrhizobium sp. LHD-71]|nr:hypothetical protein [Bradyrhizobium sp. LHD-71]MDQ8729868.1 hypothetical protein [Bradyrhizobium sp. LHD-71]